MMSTNSFIMASSKATSKMCQSHYQKAVGVRRNVPGMVRDRRGPLEDWHVAREWNYSRSTSPIVALGYPPPTAVPCASYSNRAASGTS